MPDLALGKSCLLLAAAFVFVSLCISGTKSSATGLNSRCNTTLECNKTANGSICSNNFCQCPAGLLEYAGSCFKPVSINHTCSTDGECGANDYFSTCSRANKTCQCNTGYSWQHDSVLNTQRCLRIKSSAGGHCLTAQDCKPQGANTDCRSGDCVCKSGFTLVGNLCRAKPAPVNGTCNVTAECQLVDQNTYCKSKVCTCVDGFKPVKTGNYTVCQFVRAARGDHCLNDVECQHSDPFSKCKPSTKTCYCPKDVNRKTDKCNGCALLTPTYSALAATLIAILASKLGAV